jgi:DNA-binding MarR family transcriptional regulator
VEIGEGGLGLSNTNNKDVAPAASITMAQALWDLKTIQNGLTAGLEVALGEVGFSADQFQVLASISKLGSPTMGEISQDVNMANASLSRIVDSLEDRALAFRLPNSGDRRRISVNLSDMGLSKLQQVLSVLSAWESATSGLVSDELAQSLRATAAKLTSGNY